MVPSQIAMLLDEGDFKGLDGLRKIVYGGAATSQKLLERAEAALPHVTFVQALGSTETGHLLCQTPEERRKNPQAVEKPGPRIEHCLFTEKGEVASPGNGARSPLPPSYAETVQASPKASFSTLPASARRASSASAISSSSTSSRKPEAAK